MTWMNALSCDHRHTASPRGRRMTRSKRWPLVKVTLTGAPAVFTAVRATSTTCPVSEVGLGRDASTRRALSTRSTLSGLAAATSTTAPSTNCKSTCIAITPPVLPVGSTQDATLWFTPLLEADLGHLEADLPRRNLLQGHRHRVSGIDLHHRQRPFLQLPGALGRDDHKGVLILNPAQQRL